MDSPWRPELYCRSSAREPEDDNEEESFDDGPLNRAISALPEYTREIAKSPYHPELWLNRSQSLQRLGYPDLALGDLYKARYLVEAALKSTSTLVTFKHPKFFPTWPKLPKPAANDSSAIGAKAIESTACSVVFQIHEALWKNFKPELPLELLEQRVVGTLKRIEEQIWHELMTALVAANATRDLLELSLEAISKYPDDESFLIAYQKADRWYKHREASYRRDVADGSMTPTTMEMTLINGNCFPVPYPWMTEDMLSRDDEFLAEINRDFALASDNCVVRRSTIREAHLSDKSEPTNSGDSLGVFATRNIKKNEEIFIDKTIASALNTVDRCPTCCGPFPSSPTPSVRNSCCIESYCSATCAKTALDTYHTAECKCAEDLIPFYQAACNDTEEMDTSIEHILFLRLITHVITSGASHPLKNKFFRRMKASYSTEMLTIFNLTDHIIKPIEILLSLNIDVFANPEYDTWVLHTLRLRIQNNKHGIVFSDPSRGTSIVGTSLSPLYSFHNHSCEPNASWNFLNGEAWDGSNGVDGKCSSIRVFANRYIGRGEEVCITYISPLDVPREERANSLMAWLGGDCRCTRCLREKEPEVVVVKDSAYDGFRFGME